MGYPFNYGSYGMPGYNLMAGSVDSTLDIPLSNMAIGGPSAFAGRFNVFGTRVLETADFSGLQKLCREHDVYDPFQKMTWYPNGSCCAHEWQQCWKCIAESGRKERKNTSTADEPRTGMEAIRSGWFYFCRNAYCEGTQAEADTKVEEKRKKKKNPMSTQATHNGQHRQTGYGEPGPGRWQQPRIRLPAPVQQQQAQPSNMVTVRTLPTGNATGLELAPDEFYPFPWETKRIFISHDSQVRPAQVPDVTADDLAKRITDGQSVGLILYDNCGTYQARKVLNPRDRIHEEIAKLVQQYRGDSCQPLIAVL